MEGDWGGLCPEVGHYRLTIVIIVNKMFIVSKQKYK